MSYQVPFLEAIKQRRSVLALAKSSPISDKRIIMIVKHAIKYAPSAFHVQSCRALVLFGPDHDKLWDMGYEETKKTYPPQVFELQIAPKIQGYKDAYGTVLFFDDTEAVKSLPPPLQGLFEKFPDWYEHSNGMNQFIVWTALATEGLGCSLQHYQPQVGKRVAETWDIPETWSLKAQLVFGTPTGPPRGGVERTFANVDERVKVIGARD